LHRGMSLSMKTFFFSDVLQLSDGDVIFGNMTQVGPTTWWISGYSENLQTNTSVTVNDPRLNSQPWAYTTLEVYEIGDCSDDFPSGPMQFTKLALFDAKMKPVIPRWQSFNNDVDHCGANAVINSPSSVTFNFQA